MLLIVLRLHDCWYIYIEWKCQEERFMWYYIKLYLNLDLTVSQRGESYHPVIRKITNSQLSFKDSGKRLATIVLSLLKDLSIFEYHLMRTYNRRVQADFAAFQYRRLQKSVADGIFDLAYKLAVATPPNHHSSNTTLL